MAEKIQILNLIIMNSLNKLQNPIQKTIIFRLGNENHDKVTQVDGRENPDTKFNLIIMNSLNNLQNNVLIFEIQFKNNVEVLFPNKGSHYIFYSDN